ncbi:unnamed protein product [Cuscuta epithymum]|uniref:Mitochondrial mRNA-processing protein COX24 C-terminal domain-containing protein n=1 Tax=Cuscuta epithymum TaxID=186058 RepID=A0AAV0FGR0_9ASTE|nr:unnamed protein product [Cuscuta epithymum]
MTPADLIWFMGATVAVPQPLLSQPHKLLYSRQFSRTYETQLLLSLKSNSIYRISERPTFKEISGAWVVFNTASDGGGVVDPDDPDLLPLDTDDECLAVGNLHLEPKLQLKLEHKMKMKLRKNIRLRRKKLDRKRRLRKKGSWPLSKKNKNKTV